MTTFATREKEDADDYRYFPEPDLSPFDLSEEFIDAVRDSIPELPARRIGRYKNEYGLSDYDAGLLADDIAFSDLFEQLIHHTSNYKAAANWMLGPVKAWLNENEKEADQFPIPSASLAALVNLVESNKISFSTASTKLLSLLIKSPGTDPEKLATEQNLLQESDPDAIGKIVDAVLLKFPGKVEEYKKGKKGLLALFVGEVMKLSKGKADPKRTNELLIEKLKS
jgi:aspartyl-tRNA(Asn)/glutamyl-tRNA(Gln) amidotransferase subunit B